MVRALVSLALFTSACGPGHGGGGPTIDATLPEGSLREGGSGDMANGGDGTSRPERSIAEARLVDSSTIAEACGMTGLACCQSIACYGGACCSGRMCIAEGTSCNAGSVCQSGSCVACGGAHELCCASSSGPACNAPSCCVGNTCVPEGSVCDATAGTVCVSGSCRSPVALATGQASPYGLAVSAGVAYWANASSPGCGRTAVDCGQIVAAAVSSSSATGTVLWSGSGVDNPYFIAVSGSNLGFTCNGFDHVYADTMTTTGGSHTIVYSSSGTTAPSGCAMNATTFFWADPFQGVYSVPFGSTAYTKIVSTGHPYALAVDTAQLYWSDTAAGTLNASSLTGTGAKTLASGVGRVLFLAVDAANVYFSDNYDGVIGQVPVGGGTVTTLATGESSPLGIAVDGTHVYWADGGGTIQRAPINGGTEVLLATGQGSPVGVAVDAANVYWTNNGTGEVMRLAK